MSQKMSKAEEVRYARAADWAESVDTIPVDAEIVDATISHDGRDLMRDILGSDEAVNRAMGRPNIDGSMAPGHSPIRQVRLPHELDALLTARAEKEHRKRSEVIREALAHYLQEAS